MKKRKVIILSAIIFLLLIHIYLDSFYIPRVNGWKLLSSQASPDGLYQLELWECGGGATSDFCVAAGIHSADGNFRKNICQIYHCSDISGEWLDNATVSVNGVALDIMYDTYDNTRFYGTPELASVPYCLRFLNAFFCWLLKPWAL